MKIGNEKTHLVRKCTPQRMVLPVQVKSTLVDVVVLRHSATIDFVCRRSQGTD